MRGSGDGKHTTIAEHMPSSHRRYGDWTIERIMREARRSALRQRCSCQMILEHRPIPNRASAPAWASCALAKPFGAARLEAACLRALAVGARNYGSVKSILDNRLDGQPVRRPRADPDGDEVPAIAHPNIRGSRYYH